MKISLFAVGRLKNGPMADLFSTYQKRLQNGAHLGPLECHEIDIRATKSRDETKQREAKALAQILPAKAGERRFLILDERGKSLSSPAFANQFLVWQDDGIREVVTIIGGAEGLHPDIRGLADLTLALGEMTWPHMLARCLIAEQCYRADAILAGHPYHKD